MYIPYIRAPKLNEVIIKVVNSVVIFGAFKKLLLKIFLMILKELKRER